jgi:hypothetical protein
MQGHRTALVGWVIGLLVAAAGSVQATEVALRAAPGETGFHGYLDWPWDILMDVYDDLARYLGLRAAPQTPAAALDGTELALALGVLLDQERVVRHHHTPVDWAWNTAMGVVDRIAPTTAPPSQSQVVLNGRLALSLGVLPADHGLTGHHTALDYLWNAMMQAYDQLRRPLGLVIAPVHVAGLAAPEGSA